MIKNLKKIFFSVSSVLGISFIVWIVLLLNPNLSYAHETQFNQISVFHNQPLQTETANILNAAIEIIKASEIYSEEFEIQLCMNDDPVYPYLNPFAGATAYAFMNKTVMYSGTANFIDNRFEFQWEINNYESRKYNLTKLLAHEFMHNLQYHYDAKYYLSSTLGKINWKLEGQAEYIARSFKNDGQLKIKLNQYQKLTKLKQTGIPVMYLQDSTIQNLSYYKYALVYQYMKEVKALNLEEIYKSKESLETLFQEMLLWSQSN